MKTPHLALVVLLALTPLPASSQSSDQNPAAPPKVALLVYQQTQAGRAGARQELESSLARAFDRLQAPLSWIELEAVTGPPGALFFDPGKSYDDIERAGAQLGSIFAAHPELAQKQQQVEELLTSSSTVVALRLDTLGYHADTLDLAKARFLQIEIIKLHPGHERDFADAQTTLRAALEKSHSDIARVVYQVDHGMPAPTFLIVEVLRSLKELDDRIAARTSLERTETEVERVHLEQIARDAYESRQSNLYGIHPEMSHVSKEFAMQDPQFWIVKEGPQLP
jgi:hypothetical protein